MPLNTNPKPSTRWFQATIACGEVDPSQQADHDEEPTAFDVQGEELEELLAIAEAEIAQAFKPLFGWMVQVRIDPKSPYSRLFQATIACGEVDPSQQADHGGEPTVFNAEGIELEGVLAIAEAEIEQVLKPLFGQTVQVRIDPK